MHGLPNVLSWYQFSVQPGVTEHTVFETDLFYSVPL